MRRATRMGAAVGVLCLVSWILAGAWSPAAQATVAPAAQRSCASYPTPGTIAPASTRLPAWLIARYRILGAPRRAQDRVSASDVSSTLTAAGLVLSRSRFLGNAALGGRVYLIPAQHLLSFELAPDRCLSPADRSLEAELRPQLRAQYRHWALCVVVLHNDSASPTCGAAGSDPAALLYSAGTPGFGLVPNGIGYVTLHYLTAPARTLRVHDNFYLLDEPRQSAAPCAVDWETVTGNVARTFAGCDFAQQLSPALQTYRSYVKDALGTLSGQVQAMISAIDAGDLAAAQTDWLTAHETWLDIGQDDEAYSAYGDLGGELDATAAGQPEGTGDPHFTGFHRVELDLWTDHDLAAAATDAVTLQQILAKIIATPLNAAFPDTNTGVAAWVLRPHETLEDAIRDTLTGNDDYGSGTGVASVLADISATREYLTVMAPVLGRVAPGLLPRAKAELDALQSACLATQVDGQWVAVSALPTRQRQQIDAAAGAAAETLSAIPNSLTNVGNGAPST